MVFILHQIICCDQWFFLGMDIQDTQMKQEEGNGNNSFHRTSLFEMPASLHPMPQQDKDVPG
ncbi:MAG: hypothetical protein ACI36Z_05430 [Alloprevotella sp.]